MRPLLTRDEARAIDRDAVERLGVPTLALMENAGAAAAREVLARFGDRPIVIVGGTGQNGGDAWVVARHLAVARVHATTFLVGDPARLSGDAKTNFYALRAMGPLHAPTVLSDRQELERALSYSTVAIDGLFGTGLDRPLEGDPAAVVRLLNDRLRCGPVVALDLPSGIDANTGAVLGDVAVGAAVTVTFGADKRGLWQHPGRAHAGEIVVASLGIPLRADAGRALLLDVAPDAVLVEDREPDTHKGASGRVVLFAGAPGTTGAAMLSALGAVRTGAGLVTVAPRPDALAAVDAKSLETMTAPLPAGDGDDVVRAAVELASRADAAVVGPGFGHGDRLAGELAATLPVPTVVDADALTALAGKLERLRAAIAPRVLTPHPGEAARLLATTTAAVQADRHAAAATLAEKSGHVVVLKGAGTIVADPAGHVWVCARGTPALATGGTGDVLAGMIAARLAIDGKHVGYTAAIAVLLHALAGEHAARGRDRGVLAHEVADAIPDVLTTWRRR